MEPIVFDAERVTAINLRTADGVKTVRVRFPSDDDWSRRQRKCKVIVKQLGRGKSETEIPPTEDADLELVGMLRADEKDGAEIDKYEAAKIVNSLSMAKIEDVADEPGGYAVSVRVPGGLTVHHIGMPFESDKAEYRRSFARVVDLPYGKQEITVNLAVVAPIYKRLMKSVDGYTGAVPIIHQSAALKAAIDASDSIAGEDEDESF